METSTQASATKVTRPGGQYEDIEARRAELIEMARQGDESAKTELIVGLVPYIDTILGKYTSFDIDKREMLSEAYERTAICLNKFDTKKGTKFSSYLGRSIDRAMWKLIKKETKYDKETGQQVEIPMSEILSMYSHDDTTKDEYNTSAMEFVTIDDFIPYQEEYQISKHQAEFVDEMLSVLNNRERYIIEHSYGIDGHEEMSLSDIAKVYDLSCERVRKIKENAIKKMRCNALRMNVVEA